MDIDRIKRLLNKKIEAGNKIRDVRRDIKTPETLKQDYKSDTLERIEPYTKQKEEFRKETKKEAKKEADERQDKLIEKLKEKQVELSNSIDALSEIMSRQGSVSGVKKWIDDLPSDFDPLDIIREEGEEGEEKEEGEYQAKKPKSLFNPGDTEIIKKYCFDPSLNKVPDNEEIQKRLYSLTAKMNNKSAIIKNIAKKEMKAIQRYQAMVKGMKADIEQGGTGIRRYNQPKRNAYKISQNGQYGGLIIDLPKLHGHLKVVAHKNGQKVYDKQGDFDTLDLRTKR